MTTKRKTTKATSRSGINYVRNIVEGENSIFQEIDLENDIGNDAYIEFIQQEDATGCCIAVQIKSGASYISSLGDCLILKADKNHFEYWRSHVLPVGAIVFDPEGGKAVWCDVTEFLKVHPECIEKGPYNISIPISQIFDGDTFEQFKTHFLRYRDLYGRDTNFGMALEKFANLDDSEGCFDGLYALFSFHRQRVASWFYLVTCFKNFRGHPVLRTLVKMLCHIPGHMDILWHQGNITDRTVRERASLMIAEQFGRKEVLLLLEAIDEGGIDRGAIGQCVHAIVDLVKNRDTLLKSVAFDPRVGEVTRYWALLLLIYYTQLISAAGCIVHLNEFMRRFPADSDRELLVEMKRTIEETGHLAFY